MSVRYMGVYWTPRKEQLPAEDGVMCVFHIKGNRADTIHYGGYSLRFGFRDEIKPIEEGVRE